ncbi:MAG: hypothetical protein ABH848_03000 [Candidatus Omnitrophota bacterium]
MNYLKIRPVFLVLCLVVVASFGIENSLLAADLTAGGTYTITLEAIKSNGIPTSAANGDLLNLTTTAIADANKKIGFNISGIPDSSTYNFLVVTVKDAGGDTVRQSIIPAPSPGSSVNLGVSPMTYAQTQALLSAMSTAGSDDPIMVLFGGIIVRSGGFTGDDITHLGNIGRLAIKGPNGDDTSAGFNWYLLNQAGISIAQMATFRSSIVTGLATYTSNLKDSVDVLSRAGLTDEEKAEEARKERGEAAALLSQILIDAASEADFDVGYITAAMKAASDQVENYLGGDGAGMNETAVSAMDSVMMANYMKLTAERVKRKYTDALTVLNASSEQITRYTNAINTLTNSLVAAFQSFEEAFEYEEASPDKDTIDTLYSEQQTACNAAFSQFMVDSASTCDEIDIMVIAMEAGFVADISAGMLGTKTEVTDYDNDPDVDYEYYDGVFAWQDMSVNKFNWPIPIVVSVQFVADNYGNTMTYTRDTIGLPKSHWSPILLDGDPVRTDWGDSHTEGIADDLVSEGNGIAGDEQCMPAGLAVLFGIREDIEIIIARKWAGLAEASRDMTLSGYNRLSASDKTTADGYEAGGDLQIYGHVYGGDDPGETDSDDDPVTGDDAGCVDLTSFNVIEDLFPYLTGEEHQALGNLAVTRTNAIKDNISVTGGGTITDAQKQALIDTAAMPDFQ